MLSVYALSWLVWLYPVAMPAVMFVVGTGAFIASAYSLSAGLLVVFTEVFIGSLGHLFLIDMSGRPLPLRIFLFGVVMAGSLVWFVRNKKLTIYHWQAFQHLWWVPAWGVAAIYGVARAIIQHNDPARIFDDANQWLFLFVFLFIPFIYNDRYFPQSLSRLFRAAVLAVSLLSLILLYVFTHESALQIAISVYRWARDTRISEVTLLSSTSTRVFIQSQLFLLIGWIALLERWARGTTVSWRGQILLWLITSSLFLSFSRSYWLAMGVGVCILIVYLFFNDGITSLKRLFVGLLGAIVGAFVVIIIVAYLPFPRPGAFSVGDALSNRTDFNESAVGSRWNLLPPLWNAVRRHPILGSGFGATVTYESRDPRILAASPTGTYTTHAFEWGLLDFWYKFGIIGPVLIALLLWWTVQLWKRSFIVSATSIIVLLSAHTFTPYLNHPLGFIALALISIASMHRRDIGTFLFDKVKIESV